MSYINTLQLTPILLEQQTAEHPSESEIHEFSLTSDYEGLPIKIRQIIAPNTNRVIIYAHGSFDHMDGHWGFYTKILIYLAQKKIASSVQLTTARQPTYNEQDLFSITSAFQGKTFAQELEDVGKVIDHTLNHLDELVEDPETAEIIFIGLSLGGTLMPLQAATHPRVNKLMLISSGCRTQNGALPMMDTYPIAEHIKEAAAQFKGKMLHVSPLADGVVPINFQNELFDAFTRAKKKRTLVPGADHILSYEKPLLSKKILAFAKD